MKPFDLRAGPNGQSEGRGVAGEEPGEERKHIDMGKRYGNGIQRSALSPASQLPSVVRPSPSACPPSPSFPAILAKRSRYLLLEETFCSKHSVILRTVESCDYTEPIDDAKSRPRLRFATPCAIRITRGCATRKSPFPILYNA